MTPLGDLLELLHGGVRRHTTLQAVVRLWSHHGRATQAVQAWAESRRDSAMGASVSVFGVCEEGDEPAPEETESLLRIWIDPPRAREESSGVVESLAIVDGQRSWRYDAGMGATVYEGGADPVVVVLGHDVRLLLDPSLILPHLDLEVAGPVVVAGRAGIRARAIPRPERPQDPTAFLMPHGADALEIVADAERGILLRLESRIDGEPYSVAEMVEVAFDEPIDPGLFVFSPPEGEEVRRLDEAFPAPEELPLHEIAARAPFTVFVPAAVPEGSVQHASLTAVGEPPEPGATVHLFYLHHTHQVNIEQGRAEDDDWAYEGWEERESEGRGFRVNEECGQSTVLEDREGTRILLSSPGMGIEALVEMAASMVPASDAPPRLVPRD